jgi:hypothetical protein
MATPATEAAAAAATPAAPAEGSVIAIHSLDEWSIQIEEANSAKKLVPLSSFVFFLFLWPRGIKLDQSVRTSVHIKICWIDCILTGFLCRSVKVGTVWVRYGLLIRVYLGLFHHFPPVPKSTPGLSLSVIKLDFFSDFFG